MRETGLASAVAEKPRPSSFGDSKCSDRMILKDGKAHWAARLWRNNCTNELALISPSRLDIYMKRPVSTLSVINVLLFATVFIATTTSHLQIQPFSSRRASNHGRPPPRYDMGRPRLRAI